MSLSPDAQESKFASRKYRMSAIALIAILLVFILSIGVMLYKGELAGNIVSLAQVVVTGISGLAAVFAGAQAYADGKAARPQ